MQQSAANKKVEPMVKQKLKLTPGPGAPPLRVNLESAKMAHEIAMTIQFGGRTIIISAADMDRRLAELRAMTPEQQEAENQKNLAIINRHLSMNN
jgi:hypothetical protein